MPTTYLLLRNNKQTGPHSLEELLRHSLQPHDLVWQEGRSAGWCYPTEIDALKLHVAGQKSTKDAAHLSKNTDQPVTPQTSVTNASHIYVSLPAGMPVREVKEEAPLPVNLDAKAEALYQRAQAFAEGRTVADADDTRYARSLEDMKQEYGAWQIKQKAKKKNGFNKKNLVIAAAVLIVTTTSFGISKWMSNNFFTKAPPPAGYTLETLTHVENNQTTTASFNAATDSFTTINNETTALQKDIDIKEAIASKNISKPSDAGRKNKVLKQNNSLAVDTISKTVLPTPAPVEKQTEKQEAKKIAPLSQLVVVNGRLYAGKKESAATQVTLENNSSEILKSVAVVITYFKKEDRQLSKETVYFYNVQPATARVVKAIGNRRATSARFAIGAITRADGSLYLIH